MAINPTKMRPTDVVRLLNSTELGSVIGQARIYRDFNRVGFRIAANNDPRSINLLKYCAWLLDCRNEPEVHHTRTYEEKKEAERARNAAKSLAGRDIGNLPPVEDPERKANCAGDFRRFCETYFSETFSLGWSGDHLKVISKIETAVLKGGLFALAMPRGSGKALSLETPLMTQKGWSTMGEVQVGDSLFDENGHLCSIIGKSPIFLNHKCYRVTFNDGEAIVCDADHLWQVEDIYRRKNPYVRTTEYLASRVRVGHRSDRNEHRFRIPMVKPIHYLPTGESLPIGPYTLGVWLGDGNAVDNRVTLFEEDYESIRLNILRDGECLKQTQTRPQGRRVVLAAITPKNKGLMAPGRSFRSRFVELGLKKCKHIPPVYLRATVSERKALLRGLLDTDGHCDKKGKCELLVKSPRLAEDVERLLASLGIRFHRGEKYVEFNGKRLGPYVRFYFSAFQEDHLFGLKRKNDLLRKTPPRKRTRGNILSHTPQEVRTIVSIDEVPSVPVQCVVVDSPNHLYLAGKRLVPTHNSSLTEAAALWALLYGHREFVVLIGATETAATEMIDSIKTELEVNEWLNQDFPEVCFPIRALDGIANRCAGQLYQGERTRISWTASEIILPTIAGSPASGAIVRVAGITGRVRGMKYKKPNGKSIRPSLVIIDDPQTSESASSIEQTHKRVRVLAGDILGLAGPGQKISGIMPCTIIRPGDMAEQILDRTKHPEWNGERTQMVVTFPTNTRLWEQYAEIRAENLRRDGTFAEATEFYRTHQAEMDRGAVVSWPERFNYDEISAIQHAMNLRLQDEGAFYAEYQNEPLPEDIGSGEQLSVDLVTHKLNGHPRWEIPLGCTRLTMFIDVQKTLLYYAVCAWEGDFTGVVVDYGSFPDQQRPYFTLADATHTLQHKFTRSGLEGCLYQGLQALTESLLGKEWVREDGATMKVEQCLIDANWGASTDVVYQFCRESPYAHILMPSHGRYIGASSQPLNERRRQPGERVGQNWLVPSVNRKRAIRHLVYDTNFWKSFVAARWLVTLGDRGCLSLWGRDPVRHLCYAEHLCAEYRVPTEGRGRKVDEWKLRPESHDNHWLDCTVGCAVAASMLGETLPCANLSREKKPKRALKLSSVQKRKEMGL